MGNPIASTDDTTDRKLLITDAEIEKLVPEMWDLCRNLGIEAPPPPDERQRRVTKGRSKNPCLSLVERLPHV
jgi:hypothetical protein